MERRYALKIPASVPFTEDVTYWNPSWTITHGAIETTNIDDMHASAVAIGTGRLLKPATFQQMITKDLIGKTTKVKGCLTCFPQTPAYTYGLGIVSTGNWLVQDPLFSGESGAIAYLPSQQVAIALTVTYEPAAFTSLASPKNSADYLWRVIAAKLAPADAPISRLTLSELSTLGGDHRTARADRSKKFRLAQTCRRPQQDSNLRHEV